MDKKNEKITKKYKRGDSPENAVSSSFVSFIHPRGDHPPGRTSRTVASCAAATRTCKKGACVCWRGGGAEGDVDPIRSIDDKYIL